MKSIRILAVLISALLLLPGSVRADGELQYADLGECNLESGQTIRDCRVGYRTFGTLNLEKSNTVLFATWLSGTSEDLASLGYIGPGKMADSSKYFIVAVDAFGNGVSSSPSNSKSQPGETFPRFSARDLVAAQHRLVTDHLGLSRLKGVMGISMGAFNAFQWSVSHPGSADWVVAVVGTPRQTAYDLLLWQAQLDIIRSTRGIEGGGLKAMKAITAVHNLNAWTPANLNARIRPEAMPQFLAESEKIITTYDAENWASQVEAIMSQDVYRSFRNSPEEAARTVKARNLVIWAKEDRMVQPGPAREWARFLGAETLELAGDCGHFSFICEKESIQAAVAAFLATKRNGER
ncbi:MAG: alpha/beta fold hydrolase [Syntrophaceae bacterium]|nr:alpha/beta fold hydrolase [Syntrophaceae bacterium]